MINLISESINIQLFVFYHFFDMSNISIKHWCYEAEKISLNRDILNQFQQINQIQNLVYFIKTKQKDRKKT